MNKNINEVNVEEAIVVNEVEEVAPEKITDKVKGFIKKHGKKIAAGAAIVGGILVAYAAGRNSGDEDEFDGDNEDVVETDFVVEEF